MIYFWSLFFSEELLPGWYIGVSTMRRGEKSKFLLSPEYAFKDLGSPPRVPPLATGLCWYTCLSKLKWTMVFFFIIDALDSECFNKLIGGSTDWGLSNQSFICPFQMNYKEFCYWTILEQELPSNPFGLYHLESPWQVYRSDFYIHNSMIYIFNIIIQ